MYYILDDNRLYRRDTVSAASKLRVKPKPKSRKRTKLASPEELEPKPPDSTKSVVGNWKCVCVTLQQWEDFSTQLASSKHPDERALYRHVKEDILPHLRKENEERQQLFFEEQKERLRQEAVANRKRSSRVDARMIRKREEEEKAEEARREHERKRHELAEKRKTEIRLRVSICFSMPPEHVLNSVLILGAGVASQDSVTKSKRARNATNAGK